MHLPMKITKFGHCCILIEEDLVRILIDPGNYSVSQNEVTNVHVVLITHEHQDHLHIESLKLILKNNSKARIITNRAVGKILAKENINCEILEDGQFTNEGGVAIEAYENEHATMYPTLPRCQNTGFIIASSFYYPGDTLKIPKKKIEILALPVAGPWLKLQEAIEFALAVKPAICFPVHDGNLKNLGTTHKIPTQILQEQGITYIILAENKTIEV